MTKRKQGHDDLIFYTELSCDLKRIRKLGFKCVKKVKDYYGFYRYGYRLTKKFRESVYEGINLVLENGKWVSV